MSDLPASGGLTYLQGPEQELHTAWYKKDSGRTDPITGDTVYMYKGNSQTYGFDFSSWTSITEAAFNSGKAIFTEKYLHDRKRWVRHHNYGVTPTGTLTGSDVDDALFLLGNSIPVNNDVQTLYSSNLTTVPPTLAFEITILGKWILFGENAKEHKAACVATNPSSGLRYKTPTVDQQVGTLLIIVEDYEKYDNAGVTVSSMSSSEKASIESQIAGLKATINIFETS
jgi:hypothetical protein